MLRPYPGVTSSLRPTLLAFLAGLLLLVPSNRLLAKFSNQAVPSGIDSGHAIAGTDTPSNGGACAVDLNRDGWTDLILGRSGKPCQVFINNKDGTFTDRAAELGLDGVTDIAAIVAGDFSNRGLQDLLMVPVRGSRLYLFINDGTGHFSEQAVARGADLSVSGTPHQCQSVALVDYDRDGYLDIHLTEWNVASCGEDSRHSVLLHNRGAAAPGYFENMTTQAGVTQPRTGGYHYGFSSGWADFDGDGWPDLALIADVKTSQLWWNRGDGGFLDGTTAAGVGREENGMGIAVADYDGDGLLDYFVTSIYDAALYKEKGIYSGNKLYHNLGGRHFEELALEAGVDKTSWGWGCAFLDADNAGRQDLIVTNGFDAGIPNVSGADPRNSIINAANDPTTFFQNGGGTFSDRTASYGITDTGLGRAVLVLDYDNDGALDVLITTSVGSRLLYHNDAASNGNHWLRLRFTGTQSNRDGFGSVVRVRAGGHMQTALYQPTNGFLAQHEPLLHLGLGAASSVDSLEITWPSGVVQSLGSVAADQVLSVTEPLSVPVAPVFTLQPAGGDFAKDSLVVLSALAAGSPAPVYAWFKDGVAIPSASGPTLRIARVHPFDQGSFTVEALSPAGRVLSQSAQLRVIIDPAAHSVARWWDEALLDGIRKDTPNPPVHARNLYHLSAALWDAFWAYQPEGWSRAQPVFTKETPAPADWAGGREAAQARAMSHAAYRLILHRFAKSPGSARTAYGARWLMQQLGFDPDDAGVLGMSPAAVGNRIGAAVIAACANDGANEAAGYADATGYVSANEPLVVQIPGAHPADPFRWQPLSLQYAVTQNGIVLGKLVQSFVGVNARLTSPFALAKPTPETISPDPGPPPGQGGVGEAEFQSGAVEVIRYSSMLDPGDGVSLDISPGRLLNNPLGSNAGTGRPLNPETGLAYAPNMVRRGDYARVLAEFWADGPSSETPPGHWNLFFNQVGDDPRRPHQFGGVGPELSRLEWDVRGYLALNGSLHDAACAAWTLKRQYDGYRPLSTIRYLAGLGQSGDSSAASYNAHGLPLVPGLIELVTPATTAPGGRHALYAGSEGKLALHAWTGNPPDPVNQVGGVGWILADNWVPYQMSTFVTPAFPGYLSGHSTFSRTGAEVLTLLTGSPYFPGGLGSYSFKANSFLTFEKGPSQDLSLQWATYYDAADQAGISRLYGGIHVPVDDFTGRILGSRLGLEGFLKAQGLRSSVAPGAGLVNISARGVSGSGDRVLIAGFVVEGRGSRPTLVRAVGPTLAQFGLAADQVEPDPSIELHDQASGAVLAGNDNWGDSPGSSALDSNSAGYGAFSLPVGSHDAATLVNLDAGAYTLVARGADPAAERIQLVEVYGERLSNVSVRGHVGAGAAGLVAGFSLETPESRLVLIRGIGPSLAVFGVADCLADPFIRVWRLGGASPVLVAANDNWSSDDRSSLTQSASAHAGAFAIPQGSLDAALLLQLPQGNYSVELSGEGGAGGTALLEVYLLK